MQRSQAARDRLAYSAPRTASSRNIGSSGRLSELVCVNQSVDYRELYNRILPYVRDFIKAYIQRSRRLKQIFHLDSPELHSNQK